MRQKGLVRANAHALKHLIHIDRIAHVFQRALLTERVVAKKWNACLERKIPLEVCIKREQHDDQRPRAGAKHLADGVQLFCICAQLGGSGNVFNLRSANSLLFGVQLSCASICTHSSCECGSTFAASAAAPAAAPAAPALLTTAPQAECLAFIGCSGLITALA
eukprot:3819389-Pleurochrysis_carterae.AAC.5